MIFNATSNNISAISCRSVLLAEVYDQSVRLFVGLIPDKSIHIELVVTKQ